MSEFPLKIGESSVVNISTADGCVHPLYVIPRSSTEIKILNIPPFYNRSSLYSFFSTFGPISRLSYSKQMCFAEVEFRISSSVEAIVTSPMTTSYAFPVAKLSFDQIITDSRKTWLNNAEALKLKSEEALQKYFEEKLYGDQESEEEEDGWIVAKPKKRRIR